MNVEPNFISDPDIQDRRREAVSLLVTGFLSICIFVFAHWTGLTSPYVINDDVRQQIYWMQEWRDPQLFQADWLSDYARHYVPWGVQSVYRAASVVFDPVYFSKLLAGALFVFLAVFIFKIGEAMTGERMAWAAVGIYWLMPFFLHDISGGLARSFAAPLLALFWLCWLKQSSWGITATLFLQAVTIPYICLLCATALAFSLACRRRGAEPAVFPSRPVQLAVLCSAGVLVLLWMSAFNSSGYGPLVRAGDMAGKPEFTEQGRYWFLPPPSILHELVVGPLEFIVPLRKLGTAAGVVICALLAGMALRGACLVSWPSLRTKLRPVACIGAASLFLYAMARIFLMRLFVPSRYIMYTANLFYCIAFALFVDAVLRKRSWPRPVLVVLFLAAAALSAVRLRNVGLYDYSAGRDLYSALQRTSKDALIAGHPRLMDNVLTFGRRPVFASFELAHPWSVGLWQRMKPRLQAFFTAYYAENPEDVTAFCKKYGVDFIVIDKRHFEPGFLAHRPFFAPFDDMIRRLVGSRRHFAALSWEHFQTLPVNDHVKLLDMRRPGPGSRE